MKIIQSKIGPRHQGKRQIASSLGRSTFKIALYLYYLKSYLENSNERYPIASKKTPTTSIWVLVGSRLYIWSDYTSTDQQKRRLPACLLHLTPRWRCSRRGRSYCASNWGAAEIRLEAAIYLIEEWQRFAFWPPCSEDRVASRKERTTVSRVSLAKYLLGDSVSQPPLCLLLTLPYPKL